VLLGNGMYNVPTSSRYAKFTGSFGSPKLILRLQMEFSDGSKDAVASDTSWTATAGPITFTSIYGGEDFDARQEPAAGTRPALPQLVEAGHSGQRNCAFTDRPVRTACEVMQEFPRPKPPSHNRESSSTTWARTSLAGPR